MSLRPPCTSAHVVDRSAPYGDWHGDSCSYAKIEMSNADYTRLLTELEADKRLRAGHRHHHRRRTRPQPQIVHAPAVRHQRAAPVAPVSR
ncbi:hypothetical protein LP420_16640 [Massilia sp. B-10]|nr:hypothetical protein LP420_16640 [Massilia sp. B-10]